MKKIYTVVIHYEGGISYEVEAENEDTARDIASGMFMDEDDKKILNGIDWDICDCCEED